MSDHWEYSGAAIDEGGATGTLTQDGFKLR